MVFAIKRFIQSYFFNCNCSFAYGCPVLQKSKLLACSNFSLSTKANQSKKIDSITMEQDSSESFPIIKRLDSPEFYSIFSNGLKKLQELFLKNNFELRLCGGAVRDLLLGKTPKDLDFATVATPDQMISMFEKEGIRLINETGWGHGTVTCRLEEENFEITTLRIDTVTDGRRAVVEFTTDWKIDASRRDLTFNSMFLTLNGDVIDYFNGMEDLYNRQVKFVGDPEKRIMEDYLRILRYFRFFGRVAEADSIFDQSTIDVISKNVHGLKRVAGERIFVELEMIFTGNHVVRITKMMHKCGLFDVIGLPNNPDLEEYERVYNSSKHLSPHFMTYVTAMLQDESDLLILRERVKFSNEHFNVARFILKYRSHSLQDSDLFQWYIDILVEYDKQYKQKSSNNYFFEFLKYKGDIQALRYFTNFCIPRFPVSGTVIKERTGAKGKLIGSILNMLFGLWKNSRYTLSRSELLDHLDDDTILKLKESLK